MNSLKIKNEKLCASCYLVNDNNDLYCDDCNVAIDESYNDPFKQKITDIITSLKAKNIIISKYGIIGNKYGINTVELNKMDEVNSALELIDCHNNIFTAFIEIPSIFRSRITINRDSSSYGLKHVLEDYINKKNKGGFYISNGEFIIAMLLHGYNYKIFKTAVIGHVFPNMYFNFAKK